MARKVFALGATVCDMHYGLPTYSGYPERVELEIRSHIQIDLKGSSEVLNRMLDSIGIERIAHNKIAIVVDYKFDGWCVAAYSYDDRHFGMFEFRQVN